MTRKFPAKFLWGASTAAHQVEGNNIYSDWWAWEQNIPDRPKSGVACNHYKLYKQDFALAKSLKHNVHRLSVEWARIEPTEGYFDEKEIKHYKEVLQELRNQGMKIILTLWHFSLPKWFADKGGFEKLGNVRYFERYVETCGKNFGEWVDYWVTINEPNTYISFAYLNGMRPPQKINFLAGTKVYLILSWAHRRAYGALHRLNPKFLISAAHQMTDFYPASRNAIDKWLCGVTNFYVNDLFLLMNRGCFDYFGLNYYLRISVSLKFFVTGITNSLLKDISMGVGEAVGWKMDPEGLYNIVKKLQKEIGKPIIILENGVDDAKDLMRQKLIMGHLEWLHKAIAEGVDIFGYLHWSLIDNFEWHSGFEPRFGLVEMDYSNLKRTPRPSALVYAEIIKNNKLPG